MADAGEAAATTAKAGGSGLQKKLGPLPIWAWAAVVVGTYLLYHYLKSRNSAASAAGSAVGGTVAGGNNAPGLGYQIGPGGQIYDPTTGTVLGTLSGTTPNTGSDTTTPQGWLAAAQSALQGLGLDNNTINGALNDYVAGNPLPQSEYNIVQEALKIVGAAPSSLGNPSLAPPPVTPTAPPSPTPAPTSTNNPSGANPPSLGSILPAGDSVIGNVVSVFQTLGGGWIWVTNQGYVYSSGANAPYYGGTDNGKVGGPIAANIVSANPINSGPNAGGYQLVAANGDTYNFGPNANYA